MSEMERQVLSEKALDNPKVFVQTVKETGEAGYCFTHKKLVLPNLTDEELLARYRKVKPIVLYGGVYHYLKRYNVKMMRCQAFNWGIEKSIRATVDMKGALTIGEFPCYHTCSYIGFFKPSIAEVLQQFPDELLEEANAFELEYAGALTDIYCHKSKVKALKLK